MKLPNSEFSIFVLSQDADLGSRVKLVLSQAGFETFFFADYDEMFQRVQLNPPHIIVLDHQVLVFELAEFFEKILGLSAEIKIVVLTESDKFIDLLDFKNFNLIAFFERLGSGVALQVLSSIELASEVLYRTYQNEQMFNRYQNIQSAGEQLKQAVTQERQGPQVRPFQMRISEYKMAESKEQLLQLFFKQSPQQSWVFLKFIKSIQTYITVIHQNMEESWVEGLSFKIPNQALDFNQKILIGDYPEILISYLKSRWNVEALKILPLTIKDQVEGIFVTTQDISAAVAEDFSLMSIVYQLMSLEAQPLHLDVEDPLTGFYNQLFYKRVLDKEIDRSKRTLAPLSIVKISVDALNEIEVSQGRDFSDEVIKKVASVITKSSRLPDYACRTGENEFSLVLINCNRKGAALRAERLRQVLKTESFSKSGFVISVSQGISEYPSLTRTAQMLDESSRKALEFISTKGGDKICIYKAPQDHQPDFQVDT